MGTKMAVSFANMFMAELISSTKVLTNHSFGKRHDNIFSLRNINKEAINNFMEQANTFHPTIKFTAEISDTEITFLDTCVYKGDRFKKHSFSFLMCARTLNRQTDFPIHAL